MAFIIKFVASSVMPQTELFFIFVYLQLFVMNYFYPSTRIGDSIILCQKHLLSSQVRFCPGHKPFSKYTRIIGKNGGCQMSRLHPKTCKNEKSLPGSESGQDILISASNGFCGSRNHKKR